MLNFRCAVIAYIFSTCIAFALPVEKQIDAVVATVNGKPITLSEVTARLNKPRTLSLSEAAKDPEASYALDSLILEIAVAEEAAAKKLSTSEKEIDGYISEVAARNGMSVEEFSNSLKKEKRSLEEYRRQVKTEILKSKLASSIAQSGVAVSDSEVDSFLELRGSQNKSTVKITLRQILISTANRSDDEAKAMAEQVERKLSDGDDFEDLAKELSDSPEGKEGGLLGSFSESDLSPEIFDAVFSLKVGEHSRMVGSRAGYHFFMVEDRTVEEPVKNEKGRQEAKEALRQQKLEERLHSFFANDLLKSFTIDRKI